KAPRLDLIQVHNLRDLQTQLTTLRKWKEAGRVRYIGVTHYTVASHEDLARVISREKLDFVQCNYSAGTRDAEQRLLPLAAQRGVGRRPDARVGRSGGRWAAPERVRPARRPAAGGVRKRSVARPLYHRNAGPQDKQAEGNARARDAQLTQADGRSRRGRHLD